MGNALWFLQLLDVRQADESPPADESPQLDESPQAKDAVLWERELKRDQNAWIVIIQWWKKSRDLIGFAKHRRSLYCFYMFVYVIIWVCLEMLDLRPFFLVPDFWTQQKKMRPRVADVSAMFCFIVQFFKGRSWKRITGTGWNHLLFMAWTGFRLWNLIIYQDISQSLGNVNRFWATKRTNTWILYEFVWIPNLRCRSMP